LKSKFDDLFKANIGRDFNKEFEDAFRGKRAIEKCMNQLNNRRLRKIKRGGLPF